MQIKLSIAGGTDSVEEAIRRTFLQVDETFCEDSGIDAREEGSTAVYPCHSRLQCDSYPGSLSAGLPRTVSDI